MSKSADESEMAFQFGRLCREIFPELSWENCEERVRRHWEGIRAEATWDRVRERVRQGWVQGPPNAGTRPNGRRQNR